MIFAHTCDKCGKTSEPGLTEVGQVLVITCGDCLAFIRYGHTNEYPQLDHIKQGIWDLCEHDIGTVKLLIPDPKPPRRVYWRLYRELANKLSQILVSYYAQ